MMKFCSLTGCFFVSVGFAAGTGSVLSLFSGGLPFGCARAGRARAHRSTTANVDARPQAGATSLEVICQAPFVFPLPPSAYRDRLVLPADTAPDPPCRPPDPPGSRS